jgi:hypothetical protein
MQLSIDSIRTDGGTQPRAELRNDVVEEYAELMRAGAAFPPVLVFYDGRDYWLADGFHRIRAWHRARPHQPIEVEVLQGTLDDARWYSYGVNKAHGLRRTNEDKERAVRTALLHPKAAGLSNVQIAEHCGVHERTVRRYREKAAAANEEPPAASTPESDGAGVGPEPSTSSTSAMPKSAADELAGDRDRANSSRPRSGRDGRTINTANIGKNRRGSEHNGCGSLRPFQPVREAVPMEKMTALSMPHNPAMGAMALISVFDRQYLRSLIAEITRYLKENEA